MSNKKVLWRIRKWELVEYETSEGTFYEVIEDGYYHEVQMEEGFVYIYGSHAFPKDVKKRILSSMRRLEGAVDMI